MVSDDDGIYKELFAHPEMVRDLLLGFVDGDWVRALDLASLQRVSGSYVGRDGRQRHSDMVWKVRHGADWVYIYLLLEFQSRPDHWMALRMQVYVGLLYQDLVKRHELPQAGCLPPVFPIVLYTGRQRWGASAELNELITGVPASLQHLQPKQQYVLVDLFRLPAKRLSSLENLAAALFTVQRSDDEIAAWEAVQALQRPGRLDMATEFRQRLGRSISARLNRYSARLMMESREGDKMTVPDLRTMKDVLQYEFALTARKRMLERLLTKRFGKIPRKLHHVIVWADEDFVDIWEDRIFDARNLKELFAGTLEGNRRQAGRIT